MAADANNLFRSRHVAGCCAHRRASANAWFLSMARSWKVPFVLPNIQACGCNRVASSFDPYEARRLPCERFIERRARCSCGLLFRCSAPMVLGEAVRLASQWI